jgi:hypothetical protein
MSPSRPFILRPVATSLLMAAIFLVGAVAYTQLPVSALPQAVVRELLEREIGNRCPNPYVANERSDTAYTINTAHRHGAKCVHEM